MAKKELQKSSGARVMGIGSGNSGVASGRVGACVCEAGSSCTVPASAVTELRKKADELGTALSLVVFALVGVAVVAYLALRRMFTLLARTGVAGKAAGHRRAGAHNV